ncbi:hypothetical protein [Pedobacter miscanthi]|uniref:Uncharacterized protein n=1 Tax=Pedobacter miscanthi TaxID=2259170 RepID=A0A366LEK1_9SPHI|nr:hypothetical protein [Pedobacter miscanthi]RBQ11704.1 hypothetical protein DRW42_00020 [Pedobacter miscanthi]
MNRAIADELVAYMDNIQTPTQNDIDFLNWSIAYLKENPEVVFSELKDANNANIVLPNLDLSALNNYPKFRALVNDLPNFLTSYPNILKALSLTNGLTEKKIKDLMQPGKGPKVIVVNNLKDAAGNDVVGQFDNVNKILKIGNGYVDDLDRATTRLNIRHWV